jgi:methyl coenzyme M reductase subunit D
VKNLEKYNEHEVGKIKKIDFKGNELVSEITEIVELPNGFIMVRERMTGDKQTLADYQKMTEEQQNQQIVEDMTPNKKWWQFWKGAQTK